MKHVIIYILLATFLTACGISRRTVPPSGSSSSGDTPTAYRVSKYESAKVSLRQAYRDWKGTPYRLGGRSSSGVDCSSFVSIVFDEYFGVNLPKHTRRLLTKGEGIRRRSVRTGDLVFFKTGRRTFHVGILIEDGEFLHASTSEGVTMSSIYDSYWANRYLGARRVM
ncbi:NlpC/P60 family protein [Aliifodinibius sp. S!AR15-10]|uniref:NlpC/P60 family protein n=1 Tax=Aliifodinibius sp. S!AR15-10 TaxID=2950437 RepID=UPI0028672AC6|nr:NlpC/P60 family protein [Aliifodinibius sp. S!AR15-10]MDR8393860.1 NlpC/P60 family protein [Aliifodinibius sp. S!AR15-10]